MAVQFFFLETTITLKERNKLKAFIGEVFKKEKKTLGELNYIFCSDKHLLSINKEFLQHDFYTDILTFDLSETKNRVDGEVYISLDRVRDNAVVFMSSLNKEFHRVIFHGALHLCGYKDKSPKEEAAMRAAENKYLDLYFK
jgi:probable rRNA maturation factor